MSNLGNTDEALGGVIRQIENRLNRSREALGRVMAACVAQKEEFDAIEVEISSLRAIQKALAGKEDGEIAKIDRQTGQISEFTLNAFEFLPASFTATTEDGQRFRFVLLQDVRFFFYGKSNTTLTTVAPKIKGSEVTVNSKELLRVAFMENDVAITKAPDHCEFKVLLESEFWLLLLGKNEFSMHGSSDSERQKAKSALKQRLDKPEARKALDVLRKVLKGQRLLDFQAIERQPDGSVAPTRPVNALGAPAKLEFKEPSSAAEWDFQQMVLIGAPQKQ